jgi:molybdenum cofactor synthesis domain-containing protein
MAEASQVPAETDKPVRAALIVLCETDRAATSGAHSITAVENWLRAQNFSVAVSVVIDYDTFQLNRAFEAARAGAEVVIVCGGTGLGEREITPQTLERLCDYAIPGIGEMLRAESLKHSPNSYLSRCGGYVSQGRLVLALPGSAKAAVEQLEILKELLPHAINSVKGRCKSRRKLEL